MGLSPTTVSLIKSGLFPFTDQALSNLQERARVWRRHGSSPQNAAKLAIQGFIADDGNTLDEMQALLEKRNKMYYQQRNWIE